MRKKLLPLNHFGGGSLSINRMPAFSSPSASPVLAALRRVLAQPGAPLDWSLSLELRTAVEATARRWSGGASRMLASSATKSTSLLLPPPAAAAPLLRSRGGSSSLFASAPSPRAGFSGRRRISASASASNSTFFSSSLLGGEGDTDDGDGGGSSSRRRGRRGGRSRGGGSPHSGAAAPLLLRELLPVELRGRHLSTLAAADPRARAGKQRQQLPRRALSSSSAPSPPPSPPPRNSPQAPSSLPGEPETPSDSEIVRALTNSILSRDNADLRWRIAAAMGLLVGAKLLSVGVPFLFKAAVDALAFDPSGLSPAPASATGGGSLPPPLSTWLPASLLLGYGAARAGAAAAGELRNAVFAAITQATMRRTSRSVFGHLLDLDLGFHLGRQPGALCRSMDRGSRGINFLLSSAVFNVVPTALEVALVSALLAHRCGGEFAALVAGTVGAYAAFTLSVTSWRTGFRREMNAADAAAGAAALDSLVNFEAVRANGGEKAELKRYDDALSRYESAALRTATSLAALNFGQAAIFSCSLAGAMALAARGVADGSLSVGDVVLGEKR